MCKPMSGILLKSGEVKWSKYSDSHQVIIEEYKLNADGVRGANIVPFEITPPDGNLTTPLDKWEYRVDDAMNGQLPEWYDAAEAEKAARLALVDWHKQKIVTQDTAELIDGEFWIYGGTIQYVRGGTIQCVRGGTIQYVDGGTIQYVRGGTIQYVRGGTIQSVRGGTIQCVRGGTIQYVDGGTIQYVRGGTIQCVDGGTIQSVYGGTIQYVRGGTIQCVDGGTIQYVYGGTIIVYTAVDPSILKSSKAVMVDRSGDKVVCHIGKDE